MFPLGAREEPVGGEPFSHLTVAGEASSCGCGYNLPVFWTGDNNDEDILGPGGVPLGV